MPQHFHLVKDLLLFFELFLMSFYLDENCGQNVWLVREGVHEARCSSLLCSLLLDTKWGSVKVVNVATTLRHSLEIVGIITNGVGA